MCVAFDTFTKSIELKRDTEYFQEKISSITSAEELVSDRRLLTVALGAFGLQDDTYILFGAMALGTSFEIIVHELEVQAENTIDVLEAIQSLLA